MEMLLDVLKWSGLAGAAALALTLLKPLLDRRYSARWRYWVWLALAALLLAAPVQWEALLPRVEAAPPVVIQVPRMELRFSREEGIALQRPAEMEPVQPAAPVDRADSAPAGGRCRAARRPELVPGPDSARAVAGRGGGVRRIPPAGDGAVCPAGQAVEPGGRGGDGPGL